MAARDLGLLIVAVVLIAMLAMTWRTWPEPVIDFGRELYVPWQLSRGKVLYRDIAYFNGPLSPYFNSLVFRLLGVSLMKLVAVNVAILVGVLLMMHRLAARMSSEFAATIACGAFVILLATGQPGPIGNYNFLTPYSHEMTHGLALSLAAIVCLAKFIDTQKRAWIGVSGALIGLVFLTKPEIFAAASISVLVGVVLATRRRKRRWIDLALFAACAIAVVLIAVALLSLALPFHQAIAGILGAWRWAMDPRINGNPFYQRVRGTLDLDETLQYEFVMSLGYIALFALPATIGWVMPREGNRWWWQMGISLTVVAAALLEFNNDVKWEEVGRPMIFFAIICVVVLARSAARKYSLSLVLKGEGRGEGSSSPRGGPDTPSPRVQGEGAGKAVELKFVFALFSLLMLGKVALHVQFYHYCFVLAAPVLMLAIMTLLCWLPGWIDRSGGSGALLVGSTLAAVIVTVGIPSTDHGFGYLRYIHLVATHKPILVGTDGDAFYAAHDGESVNRIVQRLKELPPDAKVTIVPQGVMIDYLARRESSIPFIVQMPPEVIMFTQGKIIDSFAEHPPDYIVYLVANTSEYGFRGYNVDFGQPIFQWIVANYHRIDGDEHDANLPWRLLQRN